MAGGGYGSIRRIRLIVLRTDGYSSSSDGKNNNIDITGCGSRRLSGIATYVSIHYA